LRGNRRGDRHRAPGSASDRHAVPGRAGALGAPPEADGRLGAVRSKGSVARFACSQFGKAPLCGAFSWIATTLRLRPLLLTPDLRQSQREARPLAAPRNRNRQWPVNAALRRSRKADVPSRMSSVEAQTAKAWVS